MRVLWVVSLAAALGLVGCPAGMNGGDSDDDSTGDDDTGTDDDDDDDDDTGDDDTADDDTTDDDTEDDDSADDDSTGDDDTTEAEVYPPTNSDIFVMYAYPAHLVAASVDAYLSIAGASWNGTYWTYTDSDLGLDYRIHQCDDTSCFIEGVQTADSIVIYAGHSNYGLGATFSELEDHSEIEHVETPDDFFGIGSEMTGMNFQYLKEMQKYPNLTLRPEDIPEAPLNYMVPYLSEHRFPNNEGVAPGQAFSVIGYDVYGYPVHYHDAQTGTAKTIVNRGQDEVPDNMQYAAIFFRSCSSSWYYIENFDQGMFFYSTAEVNYDIAIVYRFIRGIIRGDSWNTIRDELNALDPIYDFIDFDSYPPPNPDGVDGGSCLSR